MWSLENTEIAIKLIFLICLVQHVYFISHVYKHNWQDLGFGYKVHPWKCILPVSLPEFYNLQDSSWSVTSSVNQDIYVCSHISSSFCLPHRVTATVSDS